jgi:hypothetical protein
MLPLSRIFKKIVPRLFHPHSFQISVNKVLREQVVNGDTQIFCGGHLGSELLIKVQIGVVKAVDHVGLHTTIQVSEVTNRTGHRIHLAADGYLDHVIVPVPVGITALAVDGSIFLLAIGVGVQTMRGAEDISP